MEGDEDRLRMAPPSRRDVTFSSGGIDCQAWLYLPGEGAQRPVIVMAHGLGCVRQQRLDAYAQRFAEAGYACLVFDYRHFGDSGGEPRQLLTIRRQLADWSAAVAYARTVEQIDPAQLVLWGTSLSGGHVIVTASRLPGIAAVVAQCPFTDGLASAAVANPRASLRVIVRAFHDKYRALRGGSPIMIDTTGSPGSAALMTTPDAQPGITALTPPGAAVRGDVAARIGINIVFYRPGRRAARVPCPILFGICDNDGVAPAGASRKWARRAPLAEIVHYPEGHFAIYLGDAFERAVSHQIAFLRKHISLD